MVGYMDQLMYGPIRTKDWSRQIEGEGGKWKAYLITENANDVEVGENADVVVLYAHGGGYTLGHPMVTFAIFVRWIKYWKTTHDANTHIVSVSYGLTPEHSFPSQRNTFVQCYQWLVHEKGINPSRIAFAGDSAGGNLVLISALHIIKNPTLLAVPPPSCILGISPFVSGLSTSMSWKLNSEFDYISDYWLDARAQCYLRGTNLKKDDGAVSPLFEKSLHGLPRMWMCVGDCEVFRDDVVAFARKANEDGVSTEIVVEKGNVHNYAVAWSLARNGAEKKAMKQMGKFIFGETCNQ
ncbi:6265_t:CDS:2 [Paraglomus occultum]|uniref:6265_t:CDS:1 n=1 Tax=Paraglomus occultum TaxID=144539 RepID=A0A9N8ZAF6_9GLOM|nr:6265_t:CDS:2 [Paraglomus occultum]